MACVDLGGEPPPLPDALPPSEAGLPDGAVYEAAISTLVFRPNPLEIPRGATVRWTNLDPVPHTVTNGVDAADPQAGTVMDGPLSGRGSTFEHTFTEAGEWIYFCRTHPSTTKDSRVVVR